MALRSMLKRNEAIHRLNELGKEGIPFSFFCDFLGQIWHIATQKVPGQFRLQIDHSCNSFSEMAAKKTSEQVLFDRKPISKNDFKKAFEQVVQEINLGNSFLTNLTFETPIETNVSLEEIFNHSSAKYKLLLPGQFVVFSPETFVKIREGCIYSYPMKGTINAELPNAKQTILQDLKEKAEHVTIVDLIRNDLSLVADGVEVTKFRYVEELNTNDKKLLQISSEIKGRLPQDWKENIGTIFSKILPAGSISGAPKKETVRVIQEAETYKRGFYSGVCGHFDGQSLDSGVMIRFIKQVGNQLIFCSGGGITSFSEMEKEYQEMIDKVYLAF